MDEANLIAPLINIIATVGTIVAFGYKFGKDFSRIKENQSVNTHIMRNEFKTHLSDLKSSIEERLDREVSAMREEVIKIKIDLARDDVNKEQIIQFRKEIKEELKLAADEQQAFRDRMNKLEYKMEKQ